MLLRLSASLAAEKTLHTQSNSTRSKVQFSPCSITRLYGLGSSKKQQATDIRQLRQNDALEAYDTEYSSQAIIFPNSNLSDREKLLSTIANVPNVFQVLHFASDWYVKVSPL